MTDINPTTKDRAKAYSAAEKRLRQKYHTEFQNILREELAKVGLEPAADKRRAKAEADLARIKSQFPDLVDPAEQGNKPKYEPSGLDEFVPAAGI